MFWLIICVDLKEYPLWMVSRDINSLICILKMRNIQFLNVARGVCYIVMPFGLKSAGATYQRAMSVIFQKHLHKTIECYVDDLVIKSKKKEDHLKVLWKLFDIMRKYQLNMNPIKSFQGVSNGKFLGFIVTLIKRIHRSYKVKAIWEMQPPRNLKEFRVLQWRLVYIRRFIANLSWGCQPFAKLIIKEISFVWYKACQ